MSETGWTRKLTLLLATVLIAGSPALGRAQAQVIASAADYEGPITVPRAVEPANSKGAEVFRAARAATGPKILVSIDQRWLWYVDGRDTIFAAPIAVGMHKDFEYNGQTFRFNTPRGRRVVQRKEQNPVWTPPAWHYYEKSVQQGLIPIQLNEGEAYELSDGTFIEVRDSVVGRINHYGFWHPWTPGMEIIFDGYIFIPPLHSPQRRVPDALGPRKLDMGDGYLIHGTHIYNKDSIGQAVSHGCVRMRNEDVLALYEMVKVGTPVFIF